MRMGGRYTDVHVRVTASAPKEYIRKKDGKHLEVAVKEKATEGRANEKVKQLVSKFFSVPAGNVQIIQGRRSRGKLVRVYARQVSF